MGVDGEYALLSIPAQMFNGNAMIPLRAVSEAAGMMVRWDGINHMADIFTGNAPNLWSNPATWSVNSTNWPEHLPSHAPGSITLRPESEFSGLIDLTWPMQFRYVFFGVPSEVLSLVDDERLYDWVSTLEHNRGTMLLVSFVQYFDISREAFDTAVSRMETTRLSRGSDLTDEWNELPNADIIFTFDNDIIRYFYRRE